MEDQHHIWVAFTEHLFIPDGASRPTMYFPFRRESLYGESQLLGGRTGQGIRSASRPMDNDGRAQLPQYAEDKCAISPIPGTADQHSRA